MKLCYKLYKLDNTSTRIIQSRFGSSHLIGRKGESDDWSVGVAAHASPDIATPLPSISPTPLNALHICPTETNGYQKSNINFTYSQFGTYLEGNRRYAQSSYTVDRSSQRMAEWEPNNLVVNSVATSVPRSLVEGRYLSWISGVWCWRRLEKLDSGEFKVSSPHQHHVTVVNNKTTTADWCDGACISLGGGRGVMQSTVGSTAPAATTPSKPEDEQEESICIQ